MSTQLEECSKSLTYHTFTHNHPPTTTTIILASHFVPVCLLFYVVCVNLPICSYQQTYKICSTLYEACVYSMNLKVIILLFEIRNYMDNPFVSETKVSVDGLDYAPQLIFLSNFPNTHRKSYYTRPLSDSAGSSSHAMRRGRTSTAPSGLSTRQSKGKERYLSFSKCSRDRHP